MVVSLALPSSMTGERNSHIRGIVYWVESEYHVGQTTLKVLATALNFMDVSRI